MTDVLSLRAAALRYAARCWHVFPLWPGTKVPAVPDAWQTRATTDPATIARWWSGQPYNIGLAVGPSGLLVIDLDAPKPGRPATARGAATSATSATAQVSPVADAGSVADVSATSRENPHGRDVFAALCARHGQPTPGGTLIVATASAGWHLYYQHPAGAPLRNTKGGTARSLGRNIDTRGHGGYVVAAGSVVAGRRYRVVRDADPAPMPEWLAALLRDLDTAADQPTPAAPVSVRLAGTDRRSAFLAAALTREAEHVRRAPKGEGSAVLWGAAVALGQLVAGGELDAGTAADVLEQAATAGGRRTLAEARATIRSGLRRGAARPRRVA